jgi:hypothetical protein
MYLEENHNVYAYISIDVILDKHLYIKINAYSQYYFINSTSSFLNEKARIIVARIIIV